MIRRRLPLPTGRYSYAASAIARPTARPSSGLSGTSITSKARLSASACPSVSGFASCRPDRPASASRWTTTVSSVPSSNAPRSRSHSTTSRASSQSSRCAECKAVTIPSSSASGDNSPATASADPSEGGTRRRPSDATTHGNLPSTSPNSSLSPAAASPMVAGTGRASFWSRSSACLTLNGATRLAPAARQSSSTARHLPSASRALNGSVARISRSVAVSSAVTTPSRGSLSTAKSRSLIRPSPGTSTTTPSATVVLALWRIAAFSRPTSEDTASSSHDIPIGIARQAASGLRRKRSTAAYAQMLATSGTSARFHSVSATSRRLVSGSNCAFMKTGNGVSTTGSPAYTLPARTSCSGNATPIGVVGSFTLRTRDTPSDRATRSGSSR